MSVNNFPTAAGLASSAAGFAALVRAIADLYVLPTSPSELSLVARQGSGSACRSLVRIFVRLVVTCGTACSSRSGQAFATALERRPPRPAARRACSG